MLLLLLLFPLVYCIDFNTINQIFDPRFKPPKLSDEEFAAIEMPPYLTMDTFDQSTAEKLTLVEFFSPYCIHCKEFYPEWERAYKEFKQFMESAGVQMRQVNCVESGDLCDREDVFAYPTMRIYAPQVDSGETPKSRFADTFPRTLHRTAENVQKYLLQAISEFMMGATDMPSSSELVSVDDMLRYVGGDVLKMQFVALFPSTEEEMRAAESGSHGAFNDLCQDCLEVKQTWDKLSNLIMGISETGHFNCRENPAVCTELGFPELTKKGAQPQFIAFLPKQVGISRIDYKGPVTVEDMRDYAVRLYQNYQFERLSLRGIMDVMQYKKSLPHEPLEQYVPLENAAAIVFYYDPETTTDEDRAILPYLLEYAMASPLNLYVYTAKHTKIEENLQTTAQSLVDYANYNPSKKYQFNIDMFLASSISSKPTIFVMRDNALYTSVFQSFAPEDIRSEEKIKAFLDQNTDPVAGELTPKILPHYFGETETTGNRVVVTFIDCNDARYTSQALYNMSLAAHEYHLVRQEHYYAQMLAMRQEKEEKALELKKNDPQSARAIEEMRKKVPNFFATQDVAFTFIDVSKKDDLKRARAWKVNPDNYKVGDTIVISKNNRYLWDSDGSQLVNEPERVVPFLMGFLDPTVSKGYKNWRVVGSPYGGILQSMDYVHDWGVVGYLVFFSVLYGLWVALRRKGVRGRRDSRGILGVPEKERKRKGT